MTKTFYFNQFPDPNVNILEGVPSNVTSIDVTYTNHIQTNYPINNGSNGLARYFAAVCKNTKNNNRISKIDVNWPDPVVVQREVFELLLGKNRNEKGHTVRYWAMNNLLTKLNVRRGSLDDIVVLTLESGVELIFSFNKGEKCFCGVKGHANAVQDRSIIRVIGARFI